MGCQPGDCRWKKKRKQSIVMNVETKGKKLYLWLSGSARSAGYFALMLRLVGELTTGSSHPAQIPVK